MPNEPTTPSLIEAVKDARTFVIKLHEGAKTLERDAGGACDILFQARELLEDPDLKLYEVAQAIEDALSFVDEANSQLMGVQQSIDSMERARIFTETLRALNDAQGLA